MTKQSIKKLWVEAKKDLVGKHLVIVCNAKATSNKSEKQSTFNLDTEYLSDDEFEQIVLMFKSTGLQIDFFTYEDDFFRFVLDYTPSNIIVYNSAQSGVGPGRKSLIPAFCNLHKIRCTGSNPYVVSLCRQKYHVNRLLLQSTIPVPQAWLYANNWLLDVAPSFGEKILIKPIYESASIGIDQSSIQIYSPKTDEIIKLRMHQHKQPIIVQEFISGYEVEVPLVVTKKGIFALPPVGIALDGKCELGDKILDYNKIYFDKYEFYDYSSFNSEMAQELMQCAIKAATVLGMEGLCRVDFRISNNGKYFVTDVSTNPHFVSHSSVNYAFKILDCTPADIAKTILATAISREQFYDSDQN